MHHSVKVNILNGWIGLLLCCLLISVGCGGSQARFDQGNRAYQEENFEEAARVYQALVDSGYTSPSLFYNLGNAYYRQKKVAPAIYNFEKALKLKPRDKYIRQNIEMAQRLIQPKADILPEFFYVRWWKTLFNLLPSTIWGILTILCFWATFYLLYQYFTKIAPKVRRRSFIGAILTGILAIFFLVLGWNKYYTETTEKHAIVFAETASLKSGPSPASKEVSIIGAGSKVFIIDTSDKWAKVRLTDNKEGWLPMTVIQTF